MSEPTLAGASLKGLCPRCGERTLFGGPVMLAPRCGSCGLDFTAFNVGDGPAAFLILIVGAIIAVGAISLELSFAPAWWIHAIWLPLAILLTVGGLRLGKAALLFQEYRHQAGEGRIAR
jgi:uncharacterized protein (DUF983 family)